MIGLDSEEGYKGHTLNRVFKGNSEASTLKNSEIRFTNSEMPSEGVETLVHLVKTFEPIYVRYFGVND
jgi:hypothetical protein